MRTQFSRLVAAAFFLLCASLGVVAQDKISPEAYSAVAMGMGESVGGKTVL